MVYLLAVSPLVYVDKEALVEQNRSRYRAVSGKNTRHSLSTILHVYNF